MKIIEPLTRTPALGFSTSTSKAGRKTSIIVYTPPSGFGIGIVRNIYGVGKSENFIDLSLSVKYMMVDFKIPTSRIRTKIINAASQYFCEET